MGRLRPDVQLLTLLYTIYTEKVLKKGTLSSIFTTAPDYEINRHARKEILLSKFYVLANKSHDTAVRWICSKNILIEVPLPHT